MSAVGAPGTQVHSVHGTVASDRPRALRRSVNRSRAASREWGTEPNVNSSP